MPAKGDAALRKFGAPLYSACWAGGGDVLVGGGGGKGKHGLKNRVVAAEYDGKDKALSDQVAELGTEEEVRAIAVHPSGSVAVAAVGNVGLVAFGFVARDGDTPPRVTAAAHELPKQLAACGEVKCLAFSADGASLAAGTEDGDVHVWNWEVAHGGAAGQLVVAEVLALDGGKPHKQGNAVLSVGFSADGASLLTAGEDDAAVLWDIAGAKRPEDADSSASPRAPPLRVYRSPSGGTLKGARFATAGEKGIDNRVAACVNRAGVSYGLIFERREGFLVIEKRVSADPASSFGVSGNGRLVAFGTVEGELVVYTSDQLTERHRHKGAHMIFVTALAFGPSGDTLLSVSADAGARVTRLSAHATRKWLLLSAFVVWIAVLVLLSNPAAFKEGLLAALDVIMPYHAQVMRERDAAGIRMVKKNAPRDYFLTEKDRKGPLPHEREAAAKAEPAVASESAAAAEEEAAAAAAAGATQTTAP